MLSVSTSRIMLTSQAKRFQCDQCGMLFSRLHNLKTHRLIHFDIRPYECGQCTHRFRRKHDLERHLVAHAGLKPYVCVACDKGFTRMDALNKHYRAEPPCKQEMERQRGQGVLRTTAVARHVKTTLGRLHGRVNGEPVDGGCARGTLTAAAAAESGCTDSTPTSPTTAEHAWPGSTGLAHIDTSAGLSTVPLSPPGAFSPTSPQAPWPTAASLPTPKPSHNYATSPEVYARPYRHLPTPSAQLPSPATSASDLAPQQRTWQRVSTSPDTSVSLPPISTFDLPQYSPPCSAVEGAGSRASTAFGSCPTPNTPMRYELCETTRSSMSPPTLPGLEAHSARAVRHCHTANSPMDQQPVHHWQHDAARTLLSPPLPQSASQYYANCTPRASHAAMPSLTQHMPSSPVSPLHADKDVLYALPPFSGQPSPPPALAPLHHHQQQQQQQHGHTQSCYATLGTAPYVPYDSCSSRSGDGSPRGSMPSTPTMSPCMTDSGPPPHALDGANSGRSELPSIQLRGISHKLDDLLLPEPATQPLGSTRPFTARWPVSQTTRRHSPDDNDGEAIPMELCMSSGQSGEPTDGLPMSTLDAAQVMLDWTRPRRAPEARAGYI